MSVTSVPPFEIIDDLAGSAQGTIGQCDCDCDCACGDHSLPQNFMEQAPVSALQFYQRGNLYTQALDSKYTLYYGPHSHPAVLNKAASTWLDQFSQSAYLEQDARVPHAFIEKMLALGLLYCAGQTTPDCITTDHQALLSVWLHVTDRCNLRCSYCYLPHQSQTMSFDVGQAAVRAVLRSAAAEGYSRVKLKYAGGEPLLHFPLVKQMHQYALRLADQQGLEIDGVILSNGTYLSPSVLHQISYLKLRLMISLDAVHPVADPRCDRNGLSYTSLVRRGIELALEIDIMPEISITITRRNASHLPELLNWILERDLPFAINFYRPGVDRDMHLPRLQLDAAEMIETLQAAYQVIENHLPQRSLLNAILDRVRLGAAHDRPCMVGQSYLVIDPNGQVARCQMQIEQPVSTIWADDPLQVLRDNQQGLPNPSVLDKPVCKHCDLRWWCSGGCPITTHDATGIHPGHSIYCEVYRTLAPLVWRLEGLRLLHYVSYEQKTASVPSC